MTKINSIYLSEIGKVPLLTMEEEKELAAKAFKGDKEAQNKLVTANLKFVIKIAGQYQGFNMDMDDLIMEGSFGLMKAAEKYNPESGARFITYAVFWIRNFIQKAIREQSTGIKFPGNKYDEMKKNKWKIASLDKEINGDDEDATLGSFIVDDRIVSPEEEYCMKETKEALEELLGTLNEKEKTVISYRFGLNGEKAKSLSEIGEIVNLSKERVRQIEKRALIELRKNIIRSWGYAEILAA